MPSLSEGRPNVILEALACEVPVVATDVGGIPELMVDGETGYLVPAKKILENYPEKLINCLRIKAREKTWGSSGVKA